MEVRAKDGPETRPSRTEPLEQTKRKHLEESDSLDPTCSSPPAKRTPRPELQLVHDSNCECELSDGAIDLRTGGDDDNDGCQCGDCSDDSALESLESGPGQPTAVVTSSEAVASTVASDNENICGICVSNVATTVRVACGHAVCLGCRAQLTQCPQCRKSYHDDFASLFFEPEDSQMAVLLKRTQLVPVDEFQTMKQERENTLTRRATDKHVPVAVMIWRRGSTTGAEPILQASMNDLIAKATHGTDIDVSQIFADRLPAAAAAAAAAARCKTLEDNILPLIVQEVSSCIRAVLRIWIATGADDWAAVTETKATLGKALYEATKHADSRVHVATLIGDAVTAHGIGPGPHQSPLDACKLGVYLDPGPNSGLAHRVACSLVPCVLREFAPSRILVHAGAIVDDICADIQLLNAATVHSDDDDSDSIVDVPFDDDDASGDGAAAVRGRGDSEAPHWVRNRTATRYADLRAGRLPAYTHRVRAISPPMRRIARLGTEVSPRLRVAPSDARNAARYQTPPPPRRLQRPQPTAAAPTRGTREGPSAAPESARFSRSGMFALTTSTVATHSAVPARADSNRGGGGGAASRRPMQSAQRGIWVEAEHYKRICVPVFDITDALEYLQEAATQDARANCCTRIVRGIVLTILRVVNTHLELGARGGAVGTYIASILESGDPNDMWRVTDEFVVRQIRENTIFHYVRIPVASDLQERWESVVGMVISACAGRCREHAGDIFTRLVDEVWTRSCRVGPQLGQNTLSAVQED